MRIKVHNINPSADGPSGLGTGITYRATISREVEPGKWIPIGDVTAVMEASEDPSVLNERIRKKIIELVGVGAEIIWPN